MRRIRRRGGRRPRLAKGKTDWIVSSFIDVDQPLGLVNTDFQYYTLIDEATLEEKDDKLTVLRICGEAWTFPQGPGGRAGGTIEYHHGIKVFEVDSGGALLPLTPEDPDDRDAGGHMGWMHLTSGFTMWNGGVVDEPYFSPSGFQKFGGSHKIDLTVKRKLEGREVLIFAMGAANWSWFVNQGATACIHGLRLRTLVGNL